MLSHLRQHSPTDLPDWIARADALDAHTLVIAAWWSHCRDELYFLRAGVADGLYLDQLGAALGLGPDARPADPTQQQPRHRSRTGRGDPQQPGRERLATLTDLLCYDEFDADLSRSARRATTLDPADPRWAWLSACRPALLDAVHGLVTASLRHHVDEHPWLDELVADQTENALTPATVAVLGLAAGEIRTARPVVELRTAHMVHRTLYAVDRLRAHFSGIGCHAHWRRTPPHPDVSPLVRGIAGRRARLDDPRLELLGDPDQANPSDVLAFLRHHRSAHYDTRRHDTLAALALATALWHTDRDDELWAFRTGRRHNLFLTQLGSQHALTSRKGTQDRIDRLQAERTVGRPDEKQGRELRHADTDQRGALRAWVMRHQDLLHDIATILLTVAADMELADEDREELDDLARDHRAKKYTADSVLILGWAADEAAQALTTRRNMIPSTRLTQLTKALTRTRAIPGIRRRVPD